MLLIAQRYSRLSLSVYLPFPLVALGISSAPTDNDGRILSKSVGGKSLQ